jgi:hypothetical protein
MVALLNGRLRQTESKGVPDHDEALAVSANQDDKPVG